MAARGRPAAGLQRCLGSLGRLWQPAQAQCSSSGQACDRWLSSSTATAATTVPAAAGRAPAARAWRALPGASWPGGPSYGTPIADTARCPLSKALHSSLAPGGPLGVVERLRDEQAIALPASGRRNFWEVVEFRDDATVLETWKTPEVLNLHPRDVHLFASDTTAGQHAMVVPRRDAILFKTEVHRAIIYCDKAILFPSRRLQDTIRTAQAIKSAISVRSALPFELKVLEALLSETERSFDGRAKRLGIVAETVMADINRAFHNSAGELQRLLPIQRKLTEIQHDVKEVLEAISGLADSDENIKLLCLTDRQARLRAGVAGGSSGSGSGEAGAAGVGPAAAAPPDTHTAHMRMVSTILETYEYKLQGTHGGLSEMLEAMDQTRTVWHMQLDHQRNRVLRVNFIVGLLSFGTVVAATPAAYFGMNLANGLESVPGVFAPVVQCSLLAGLLAAGSVWLYYRWGPRRRYKARLRDMRSLRDLLVFHMDDVDDILAAVKSQGQGLVSPKQFRQIVQQAVKGRPMSSDEVDLLYRVFDTNKDGFLELSELVRLEEQMDAFAHHTT